MQFQSGEESESMVPVIHDYFKEPNTLDDTFNLGESQIRMKINYFNIMVIGAA